MFIYLCMHDGGLQDTQTISKELGLAKQTVQSYVELFESTHLIFKLLPFGYGKEVLRGKSKLYLSDPAIAPAVLMKGKTILENPHALGQCVETAVIGHLWSHCGSRQARFSYWRSSKNKEDDLIVENDGVVVPLEVKYQSQSVQIRDIPGLVEFIKDKPSIEFAYVVTKSSSDLGALKNPPKEKQVVKIPAALLCYWLGKSAFEEGNILI